jgi:hypothetical protein
MTNLGCFPASTDPGKIANRAPRAPAYSRLSGSFRPMWDNSPVSSAVCTARGCGSSVPVALTEMPTWRASWRNWLAMSCHSRTRSQDRNSVRHSLRNWLEDSSRCRSRR